MEQGKCPLCGKFNLDYGEIIHDDQQIGYECHCHEDDCDFKGIEWYSLEFLFYRSEN